MNRILVVVVMGLVATCSANMGKHRCQANAVFTRCASACPKTCLDDILQDNDAQCREQCKAGCECKEGYVLNEVGECISLDDCKLGCKLHSHYNAESCSNTCEHMFDGEPCEIEKENCECDEGYFLNSEGNCVSAFECQVEEVICPVNQTFYTCASSCPLSCANMFIPEICNMMCNVKCDCLPGHVFNSEGVCILATDCAVEEIMCPSNKIYKPCGYEDRTCDNQYTPLECSGDCVPGCYCPDGDVFNTETGLCVPSYECTDSLESQACLRIDANMQYYPCHLGDPMTCKNPEEVLEGECNSGCYCKPGMVLNWDNECVLVEDCKRKKYGKMMD